MASGFERVRDPSHMKPRRPNMASASLCLAISTSSDRHINEVTYQLCVHTLSEMLLHEPGRCGERMERIVSTLHSPSDLEDAQLEVDDFEVRRKRSWVLALDLRKYERHRGWLAR